ncbi:hypothetical protein ACWA7J_14215 [Leptothrix sp. BB-4]
MGIFDFNKAKAAESRLSDEALYADALREIENGLRRDGLWARALSDCKMDQVKAAARYIELRVQSMRDEKTLRAREDSLRLQEEARQQKKQHQEHMAAAEADLPRHPACGGIIDRVEHASVVRWKCRKCRTTGKFTLGSG